MINWPSMGIKLAGIDIGNVFKAIFDILIEKRVMTENELIGFLAKAGFTFTRPILEPANNPEIDLTKHELDCLCDRCQKNRELQ